MKIDLVFVTYNRLEYTKLALASVLADPAEEYSLTIWDNGSTDGTLEYLKNEVNDKRVADIVFSKENVGPTGAMNYAWTKTKADLVGKVDNDCLVPPGWTRILAKAHEDIESLGAVACWHYPLNEFDECAVRKMGKVQSFNGHQIFRHPWVCGSGFLMKKSTFQEYGPWEVGCDAGTTNYFLKMALNGKINGWYYPLILQEHMDDPRSKYCLVTDDESIRRASNVTYVLRKHNIQNMRDRWKRRKMVLENLNSGQWDAKCYVGWQNRLKHIVARIREITRLSTQQIQGPEK